MNVLITGASKGIGKAIALNMAANGHDLALCARNLQDLEDLKQQILNHYPDRKVCIKVTDCSIKSEVLDFAAFSLASLGSIEVLVNNVGVFTPSRILEEDDDALESHMKTNVFSAYYLYKKIAPQMKERGKGYIFNICSVASIEAIVNAGTYCVTKSALLSLNNIMREEMMDGQVKVTAILPGSTFTSSWEGTSISPDEFIQPEDVALVIEQIMKMSKGANVNQIVMKPLHGQF
jgi:3-oxoacyl-[acyl-carrier protein] reductase